MYTKNYYTGITQVLSVFCNFNKKYFIKDENIIAHGLNVDCELR